MSTTDASQIHDLRSALDFLREMPGQLLETDTQVDPDAEVSGVYRHVGAGGTVMRPTKEGPAMVFNNVKGFDDAKVCIGMLASRKRVAALLDLDEEHLGLEIGKRFENLIAPEQIAEGKHVDCQEVVYKATDEGFDLRKIVPLHHHGPRLWHEPRWHPVRRNHPPLLLRRQGQARHVDHPGQPSPGCVL